VSFFEGSNYIFEPPISKSVWEAIELCIIGVFLLLIRWYEGKLFVRLQEFVFPERWMFVTTIISITVLLTLYVLRDKIMK